MTVHSHHNVAVLSSQSGQAERRDRGEQSEREGKRIAKMAFFDDRKFLLSHIRHSFITCDDTGICEMAMLNEIMPHHLPSETDAEFLDGMCVCVSYCPLFSIPRRISACDVTEDKAGAQSFVMYWKMCRLSLSSTSHPHPPPPPSHVFLFPLSPSPSPFPSPRIISPDVERQAQFLMPILQSKFFSIESLSCLLCHVSFDPLSPPVPVLIPDDRSHMQLIRAFM